MQNIWGKEMRAMKDDRFLKFTLSLSRMNKKQTVKYIKTDNSLIERKDLENEKVILTEDNRQVLFG